MNTRRTSPETPSEQPPVAPCRLELPPPEAPQSPSYAQPLTCHQYRLLELRLNLRHLKEELATLRHLTCAAVSPRLQQPEEVYP